MADTTARAEGFDSAAAITRSLLGWGVVAGFFYLAAGLTLAQVRDGFELSEHALSLLTLGEGGWLMQAAFVLTGLMTIGAGIGLRRALAASSARSAGTLVAVYGACLILSGLLKPDPMGGFPPGTSAGDPTASGLAHLALGAIGFVCVAAAAASVSRWHAERSEHGLRRWALGTAVVVVVGFLGGAALSASAVGLVALWVAVLAGWVWLALTCLRAYRSVPHPDLHRRTAT